MIIINNLSMFINYLKVIIKVKYLVNFDDFSADIAIQSNTFIA